MQEELDLPGRKCNRRKMLEGVGIHNQERTGGCVKERYKGT